MKENIWIKEKKHIKYFDTKWRVLFKSQLEQTGNLYHNNEVKQFYQGVNSKEK
jgi:hypothetical protein